MSSSLYENVFLSYDLPKLLNISTDALPSLIILSPANLIQLFPSLSQLQSRPIVFQVSTSPANDHAQILALRSAPISLLYSPDDTVASVNALIAARVAAATHRPVLHFGEFSQHFATPTTQAAAASDLAVPAYTNGLSPSAADDKLQSTFSAAFSAYSSSPVSRFGADLPETLVIALGNVAALAAAVPANMGLISLSLYRPLSSSQIRDFVPQGVKNVVVLEQTYAKTAAWSPVFLDVAGAFAEGDVDFDLLPALLSGTLGSVENAGQAWASISGTSHDLVVTSYLFFRSGASLTMMLIFL